MARFNLFHPRFPFTAPFQRPLSPGNATPPAARAAPDLKETLMYPVVKEEDCIACNLCADTCQGAVFEMEDDMAKVVAPQNCDGDGVCVENCPEEAITLVD